MCARGSSFLNLFLVGSAVQGMVVPGHDRARCAMVNVEGTHIPLVWNTSAPGPVAGAAVRLRIYFRAATVFAVGASLAPNQTF